MALVTLQRSPTPSAASSSASAPSTGEDLTSDEDRSATPSESFMLVKGTALFLRQTGTTEEPKTPTLDKNAGDLPQHLQVMLNTLRNEDRIKLAVRLESSWSDHVHYLVVVDTNGNQENDENILLGMDITTEDSVSCSIAMVLPLWSDTKIQLNGDGGFSISTNGRSHVFKPVSVQSMWSALQVLHRACEMSRQGNYSPGGTAFTWVNFYESCIFSELSCISEWNAVSDSETPKPESPALFSDQPTDRDRTECLIRTKLQSIVMVEDLDNVTCKKIRNELEQQLSWNLQDYKEFIDNEILLILNEMESATPIFSYLYLGSQWNASNLEELRECRISYILNIAREIDNFFPETFCYHNVSVNDNEATDLLAYWNETYDFILKAKKNNSKCLVHCKMGASCSASTVIAYAMKEYGWSLGKACHYVRQKNSIAQPDATLMKQLSEYEAILDTSTEQRHNRLWPSCSESEGLQAAGACGARTPDTLHEPELCPWARDASASPCCWEESSHHLNYNYYFRRLSDAALDSEPSTPVRCPPLLPTERVFIEIEDVERDALLDDNSLPTAQLVPPMEGTAAQTLEDMRLRLEFSTVEEEDEEEAQKEEAEMAALANTNRFGNENANNSNRLGAKRSCPSGFDDSASSGKPHKLKPSYQSGMRLSGGRRTHRLNLPRHAGVSIHNHHHPASQRQPSGSRCRCPRCFCRVHTMPALPTVSLGSYRQRLTSPMSCEELPQNILGPKDKDGLQEMDEEEEQEEAPKTSQSTGPTTELSLLNLSLQGERPTAELSQEVPLIKKPDQIDTVIDEAGTEDMEVDSGSIKNATSFSSIPNWSAPSFVSSSFPQLWGMTRSSSSESVGGQQETETRARLAGLTTASGLKRSNSLAKLGGLATAKQESSVYTSHSDGNNSSTSSAHAVTAPLHTFPG